jgi:hypothetical protein
MSRHQRVASVLLCMAALAAGASAVTAPSVVVAIDTSRSLKADTLAAMGEAASGALGRLPAETTVSVLAFDDIPRWVLRSGSPGEAAAAFGALAPSGQFTLLDDALFTAVRALAPGGVVLLLTDGRDENSATTVEDVARACEAQGVRVVGLGAGKTLDERRMRRLALLTGGSYVGALESVRPGQVGDALLAAVTTPPLATARRATSTVPAEPPAPPRDAEAAVRAGARENVPVALRSPATSPPATAGAATAADEGAGRSGTRRWWLLALPLALVAIAVPVAAIARNRARHKTVFCKRCGNEVPAGEDCPRCAALDSELAQQERLRNRDMTRIDQTSELRLEAVELITATTSLDAIEKTRVIADQSMLLVREPGESQRSFLLRSDGAFAVGRDPRSNTLIMRDPALSAKHFKVVPDDGWFFIVDLDSTNGTYLNRRRVRAARLSSGDVIQAGQVELEFRSFLGQVA